MMLQKRPSGPTISTLHWFVFFSNSDTLFLCPTYMRLNYEDYPLDVFITIRCTCALKPTPDRWNKVKKMMI